MQQAPQELVATGRRLLLGELVIQLIILHGATIPQENRNMPWATFSDAHLRAIDEIEKSDSDRIAAIVGVAILDDTLRLTLTERLQNDKNITGKLLKPNGALGNTEPKIDLLYLLYSFEKPVRNALYGLCHIRNLFAHNLDASFDSQEEKMIEEINKLILHDNKKYYPHHLFDKDSDFEIEPVISNRDRFLVNLRFCLRVLMRDRCSHVMSSNKPLTEAELREQMMQERQEKEEKVKSAPPKP